MPDTHKMLEWDKTGERLYKTGVDRCAIYPQAPDGDYPKGGAWNGIISITNNNSGAEASPQYADNLKYLNLISEEEYGCTIEAFMYPPEFEECNGYKSPVPGLRMGQQTRKAFGLAYRTKIGNDTEGQDHGYELHLVWNGLAAPSEENFQSINDSPEAITFSWEVTTTPVPVQEKGFKPMAHATLDSTLIGEAAMAAVEKVLWGSAEADARLPLPDEIISIVKSAGAKVSA